MSLRIAQGRPHRGRLFCFQPNSGPTTAKVRGFIVEAGRPAEQHARERPLCDEATISRARREARSWRRRSRHRPGRSMAAERALSSARATSSSSATSGPIWDALRPLRPRRKPAMRRAAPQPVRRPAAARASARSNALRSAPKACGVIGAKRRPVGIGDRARRSCRWRQAKAGVDGRRVPLAPVGESPRSPQSPERGRAGGPPAWHRARARGPVPRAPSMQRFRSRCAEAAAALLAGDQHHADPGELRRRAASRRSRPRDCRRARRKTVPSARKISQSAAT